MSHLNMGLVQKIKHKIHRGRNGNLFQIFSVTPFYQIPTIFIQLKL